MALGDAAASPVRLGSTSGTCTPAQGLTAFLCFFLLTLLSPCCVSAEVPYWVRGGETEPVWKKVGLQPFSESRGVQEQGPTDNMEDEVWESETSPWEA